MYYHDVGEASSSYTRMIFQNEMLSGQDRAYLADLMQREKEKEMAFDPNGFYICLTGLPKRVYTGRYGRDANANMVFYIQFERRMQQLLAQLNGSGEIILHLYGDKQIVMLYSFSGALPGEAEKRAETVARSACCVLQDMYEGSFLHDGAYANVTLLSRRLTAWEQIGAQMRRMTTRWNRSFFSMEAAVWKEELWDRQPTHPSDAALHEARHQLQQALITGDSEKAESELRAILLEMIKPGFDEYLLRDTLAWMKARFIAFSRTYGDENLTDGEIDMLFDASLYPNIDLLAERLAHEFAALAKRVAAQDRRYGLLTQRAIRLIREQATERDMSLSYAAERLDVSRAYLSSVFKRETGVSLTQYITQMRIAYARKLLTQTNMTIEQIAHHVGFEGKRYFGTVFKRETGMTPQAFRQAEKEQQAGG